jgi:nitroreductase
MKIKGHTDVGVWRNADVFQEVRIFERSIMSESASAKSAKSLFDELGGTKSIEVMNTFETIRARRSIKWYDATHRFTDEEEKLLLDLAKDAPSSFNAQHWRIVKISDPQIRKTIRAAAFDQAQVTDASLHYVICGDTKAWEKNPSRYFRNAPKEIQDWLVPLAKDFHEGREQLQRDEAIRSASFFALTMMLAAKAMGYESCPLIGFDADAVAKIIKLPKDIIIVMMLVVGKGIKQPWPRPGYIEQSEWLFENSF